ncbi:NAC domain-containing protein 17-like [Momordica charantia]|uniref:NAC domain-containing protein 17-like n=1 Tax=Momordica charantia TaxID=3673 RepID=A0A6J1DX50_MOMCH|nr:NAC domain-containing protein 17-like [Momordica charantia]
MKVPCASGSLRGSSGNDDKVWPPGFRFHPTDEELILYYLKRKICGRKIKLDIIADTDVYKWDPEELPGLSKLKTGDRQWFFFSPRDRKYPNGARSNRATRLGYWKATGKDRTVSCNSRDVGVKKTLVFYKGRAPNGERTDWVMHEYTLDEEELSRCTNVQNYYAIYKVFKKSGPGPKNGEQYGAPFIEEDWADDEFCDFTDDREIPAEKPNTDTIIEGETCEAALFTLDDLDKLMKQISDEAIPEFPEADSCAISLHQVGVQDESVSTVVDLHSGDHILPRSAEVSCTERQPCNVPGSFDLTKSDVSQLQPFKSPEAASAPNFSELASILFDEDFLEIDDLGGPEFTLPSTRKPSGTLPFEELNSSYELDQFCDAALFLNDLERFECGTVNNLYQNENVANPLDGQFQSYPDSAIANVANTLDGQFQSYPDSAIASQNDNQMPMPDPAINGFAFSESLPTSGVLCDPSNFAAETNQNQAREDGGSASRVSSALWAFVETIPTTPASAAENGLVNRTFDRVSSFGRRRISMKSTTVSPVDSSTLMSRRTRSRSKKGGFFLFSVLGALCAILWVFIGAIRLWERCISSL